MSGSGRRGRAMRRRPEKERAALRRRAFAELEADPRFARFRVRRGRRRLLGAHVGWGGLGYVGVALATGQPVGWLSGRVGDVPAVAIGVGAVVLWILGFVVLTGWLNAAVGGVTELPYDLLDEAQAGVRRRAESDAHRAVRFVLFLVGLWAVSNLGAGFATRGPAGVGADATRAALLVVPAGAWAWALVAVAAVASLLALLPLYLLAWRLPDDVVEAEPVEPAA